MPVSASIIEERLANALGRRDEAPNIELAEDLVCSHDSRAIAALVSVLQDGKQAARSDAIKVLYEIGEREPALIADHVSEFLQQLSSKHNRVLWGCLSALSAIARVRSDTIFQHVDDILVAADRGSVIAKDRAIDILATLAADSTYTAAVMPIILSRLRTSASNQLPMYAEQIQSLISDEYRDRFCEVLQERLCEQMTASKKRRIASVLKKLS